LAKGFGSAFAWLPEPSGNPQCGPAFRTTLTLHFRAGLWMRLSAQLRAFDFPSSVSTDEHS
jgi:hypothetical protein